MVHQEVIRNQWDREQGKTKKDRCRPPTRRFIRDNVGNDEYAAEKHQTYEPDDQRRSRMGQNVCICLIAPAIARTGEPTHGGGHGNSPHGPLKIG